LRFFLEKKMTDEMLRLSLDKFTFLVPEGLYFNDAGVWVRIEDGRARVGLSDFAQQRSGDIAFATVTSAGTALQPGDEFAGIETVKVNLSLPSPVKGTIVEINTALEQAAELINQDPYGKGWLAVLELQDWESDRVQLLDANAYLTLVKEQAEAELKP
jgi:glycine cleavage system H protein